MRTSALLKLHQRQIDILDMIITCNNRITSKGQELANLNKSKDTLWKWIDWDKHLKASIERNQAIKQRLIRYYLDVNQRIANLQVELYKQIEITEESKEADLSTVLS